MLFQVSTLFATAALGALLPPSQDSFYQPTGDWKSQAPGSILAHRTVPNPLVNVTYQAAYQLLFRTTDALNNPSAGVTTVIIPAKAALDKLLSYQVVYDTPDVDCSPSFTLQEGGMYSIDDAFTYALEFGYVVNTPDYEGFDAAFAAGVQSGQYTLDSIRATLASTSITKVESNATVVMWGYSGGALASEWATELQSIYAPELNISGTALGGLTPSVPGVVDSVNKKANAGLIAGAILGIAAAYPSVSALLNESFVSTTDRNTFYEAKKECIAQSSTSLAGVDVLGFLKQGEDFFNDPVAASVISSGINMGLNGHQPEKSNKLYVYKSTLDEVSPVADTDALVEKYCKAGANIQYVKNNYGSHAAEAVNGGTGAAEFLVSALLGSPIQNGCTVITKDKNGKVISSSTIAATAGSSSTAAKSSTAAASVSSSVSSKASAASASAPVAVAPAGSTSGSKSGSTSATSTTTVSSATGSGVAAYTGAATKKQSINMELGLLGGLAMVFAML